MRRVCGKPEYRTCATSIALDATRPQHAYANKEDTAELAADGLIAPTYNDMFLKLVAQALGEHPAL